MAKMSALRYFIFLVLASSACFAHTMPGRRAHEHFDEDGKHNAAYDHEAFLGEDGQKEFGKLDNDERVAKLAKLVDKIDKNGDNNVTSKELADWIKYISLKEPTELSRKQWKEHYIPILDENGLVSWEGYLKLNFPGGNHDEKTKARIATFRKRFVAADDNKDDSLSFDEFVAFQHMDLFPRMHDVFVDEALEPMDLNKDGVISVEEYRKGEKQPRKDAKREFDYRDLDKSGVLEKNEIKEWYFPTSYDPRANEAEHLVRKADSNKDHVLSRKEILDNFDVFVGSRATHWGETLKRSVDDL